MPGYISSHLVVQIKISNMRWAEHVAYIKDMRIALTILIRKPQRKTT
jgi:hypothetical protein